MYVIQHRIHDWDKWDTYKFKPGTREEGRYKTLKEARNAFAAMSPLLQCERRIAEEYTVVRYKAIKEGGCP
jgi:hypothetical protein